MPLRRIAILAASLLACACGETTSTGVRTPAAPKPVLSPGPRILTMVGSLGGPNSFAQPCGPSVIGFVYGEVTFSSTTGVTVACDLVFWNLVPFPTLDRAP